MEPVQRATAAVVAEILRRAPLSPEKVTFAWRQAVGPAVARVTSVRLTADETLHVVAEDARWQTEIRRSTGLIRARLVALLGNVVSRIEVQSR
jgi:predicted nucleic acid-binding Zn ribbon protein